MDILNSKLESLVNSLEELNSVLDKGINTQGKHLDIGSYLYKGVEDGILDNIHKANNHQLNQILTNYHFRFYSIYNSDKELLKNEVNRRLRDKKLETILG